MSRQFYEIRCPIHGLISMNEWERRLIDHPVFQRLRRIRQLAWTDYVYPGGMHTRFEHSIGVMHVAGMLYDSVLRNSRDLLNDVYGPAGEGTAWKERERQKVRLAALLHDVGHAPFSHASENLFPVKGSDGIGSERLLFSEMDKKKSRYKHEDYSIALIKFEIRTAIDDDDFNRKNFNITADEITDLLSGAPEAGPTLFWREILSNQLDADRMDYLLRDSHHLGVNYGKYDLNRLSTNVCALLFSRDGEPKMGIGVLKGGVHAAESLIVARYSMFKQVYFHKTRMAYDIHLQRVMSELLPGGAFPLPDKEGLKQYLGWDDWRVQGLLAEGKGGEHAKRMLERRHYRMVYSSRDRLIRPKEKRRGLNVLLQEDRKLKMVQNSLGGLLAAIKTSKNSWYKGQEFDIPVIDEEDPTSVLPLSFYSAMAELNSEDQTLLYAAPEDLSEARLCVRNALKDPDPQSLVKSRKTIPKAKETASIRKRPMKVPATQPSVISKEFDYVGNPSFRGGEK